MADTLRPDIQAAKDRLQTKIGANREINKLVEYLWEGEQVQLLAAGTYGAGQGLVALTDRRVLFLHDGWLSKTTEDFPIEKISSAQWSSGLMFGTLTIFASGNKAEISQMDKKDGKALADALRNRLSGHGQQQTAPAAPVDSAGSSFEMLKALRDRGVLTPDEFAQFVTRL